MRLCEARCERAARNAHAGVAQQRFGAVFGDDAGFQIQRRGQAGEVGFGLGVIGLDLECALVGGTRGGGLASSGEHDAEVVPAIGILRVDLQGALLFREGFFGLAEGAEELGER